MRTIALVLLMAICASCGDDLFINERMWKSEHGELVTASSGCMSARDLDGRPAKFTPRVEGSSDFGTFITTGDGAVHVLLYSQGETLATRRYDGDFLHSHNVDEFTVTTQGGIPYLIRYWGGSCAPFESDLP